MGLNKDFLLIIFLIVCPLKVDAQLSLSNGYIFPVNTKAAPVHVLLIPVELHGGRCDSIKAHCFPAGQLPVNIDNYFDATLPAGGPVKYFSKYLYQASFGNLIVLGDYLDTCVHVDFCPAAFPSSPISWTKVINAEIRKQFSKLPLRYSTPLKEFDKYALSGNIIGKPKLPVDSGNNKFDCVIYLIKNYPGYGGNNGFGENTLGTVNDLTPTMGIDQGAIFGHTGDISSIKFIMEEFFHGMFGGNNWHGGGGRSNHTFMNRPIQWGIESQNGSSQVVSGYNRCLFNWTNPPDKVEKISARNINNSEVISDLTIPSKPDTSIFVLRDFVNTGDAIRIKLPHINCSSPLLESNEERTGPEKNNYLWIENHQLLPGNTEDQNLNYNLANSEFCGNWPVCGKYWTPGLYCVIQVGKDDEKGNSEIYSGGFKDPNSLASWMFPLTANGFHDFTYGEIIPSGPECVWGNPFVPFDLTNDTNTKPNPFSGYSFSWGTPNTDGSTQLHDNDANQGVAYIDNNPSPKTLHYERSQFGDSETSFKCTGTCPANGKEILSLSTNPSPVTVMTLTSNDNYKGILKLDPSKIDTRTKERPNEYLNRTIYLNGISISILEENYNPVQFGKGAVQIKVRWDDYDVKNNVRWCADSIRLSANDFDTSAYSLNIINASTVLIDRSLSPTYDYSDSDHVNFTVPTVFTCLKNSKIHLTAGSKIIIDHGSVFELNENSRIDLDANAQIIVKRGGKLVMHANSLINLKNKKQLKIEAGCKLEKDKEAMFKVNGRKWNK